MDQSVLLNDHPAINEFLPPIHYYNQYY